MKRLTTLALLLALAGCGGEGSDDGASGAPAAPGATTAEQFASGPGTMVASGAYEKLNEANAAQGAAQVTGVVRNADGSAYTGVFEVILQPVSGSIPTRVFYGDGTGQFKLWPWPGSYTLRAHVPAILFSDKIVVQVSGTDVSGLVLKLE